MKIRTAVAIILGVMFVVGISYAGESTIKGARHKALSDGKVTIKEFKHLKRMKKRQSHKIHKAKRKDKASDKDSETTTTSTTNESTE